MKFYDLCSQAIWTAQFRSRTQKSDNYPSTCGKMSRFGHVAPRQSVPSSCSLQSRLALGLNGLFCRPMISSSSSVRALSVSLRGACLEMEDQDTRGRIMPRPS